VFTLEHVKKIILNIINRRQYVHEGISRSLVTSVYASTASVHTYSVQAFVFTSQRVFA